MPTTQAELTNGGRLSDNTRRFERTLAREREIHDEAARKHLTGDIVVTLTYRDGEFQRAKIAVPEVIQ